MKVLLASLNVLAYTGQVQTKNEGFSDCYEGWVPFLLEIKQKAGWLVGMSWTSSSIILILQETFI